MRFELDGLYCNDEIKEYISGAISSGNLPSSFIIEGDPGSGRKTLVKLIFKTLCCISDVRPCGKCIFCRRIENGNSGDIRYFGLSEGKKSIGVDDSRKIKDDCLLGPTDGEHKFYVINDADALTTAAQNALLKITEEPPPFARFFFICESAVSLLPTLRSRSVILRMQKIDDRHMTDYLIKNERTAAKMYNEDRERFNSIIENSGGSIGRACVLLRKRREGIDLSGELISAIALGGKTEILTAVLSLPDSKAEYTDALAELQDALKSQIPLCSESRKAVFLAIYDLVSEEYGNCFFNISISVSKRYLCSGMIKAVSNPRSKG